MTIRRAAQLVEGLRTATNILAAVVTVARPDVRAIIWLRPEPETRPPADFVPRAGLELVLHAHDVCAGLGVSFEPPADLCERLREHTRDWPMWDVLERATQHGRSVGRPARRVRPARAACRRWFLDGVAVAEEAADRAGVGVVVVGDVAHVVVDVVLERRSTRATTRGETGVQLGLHVAGAGSASCSRHTTIGVAQISHSAIQQRSSS